MFRTLTALLAAGLLALALWRIEAGMAELDAQHVNLDGTPVTVFAEPDFGPAPAVVIAHGFAGSQQLMQPIAVTLARAGYVAVTYDAKGHGRNRAPLAGDVTDPGGATAALVDELAMVSAWARELRDADGQLALVGHSMASDIVVRAAISDEDVAATVGLSLFSNEVRADAPRNLLVIVGAWEPGLRGEALRVVELGTGAPAETGVTYGDPVEGTARRAVFAPNVEHVGILFSATTLRETRAWLDAVFSNESAGPVDARGGWIALWLAAALVLGWALSAALPRDVASSSEPMSRRRWYAAAILPAVLTPPLSQLVPEGLMPVPVADYLSVHFALYGLICAAAARRLPRITTRAFLSALALIAFALVTLYLPIDHYLASFFPTPERAILLATLLIGLLPYFLADEALTRAPGHPRGAYPLTKLLFLASLGFALALDPPRLFFLILILPVMLLFFAIFGAFSRWSFGATGTAAPAALANAVLFAWAIAVTFPILAA